MNIVYFACVIVSLAIYLWLYITDVKKSLFQNVMILMILLSNLGYLSLSNSVNLQEAILSTKIVYISGCFIPMLFCFTVAEICHMTLKKRIIVPLILVQLVLFVFVCSIGYSTLYYKTVKFVIENNQAYLVKDYGPAHFMYPLTMYGYFLASFVIAVYAYVKHSSVNRRELWLLLIFAGLSVVIYGTVRLFHIKSDFTGIANIILMIGVIVPMYHSNLYTVYESKDTIEEQLSEVGFISFNKKLEYMGANKYAISIYPELKDVLVGKKIEKPSEDLKKAIRVIERFEKDYKNINVKGHYHSDKKNLVKKGDESFEFEAHTINNFNKKCVGYSLSFTDETDHYESIKLKNRFNDVLTRQVEEQTQKIRDIQKKTVLGMAQMVESRDLSTGGHVKRTSDVVQIFAKKLERSGLGIDKKFLKQVTRSAPMHDLGKIGVDDAILRKNGKYTDEEYEQMKKHAEIGQEMVLKVMTGVEEEEFVKIAENVAHYHHERVNGEGYPCGLPGEKIPLEAKIMALADVFDALVSQRCYKEAFSFDKAFGIIEEEAGTHFDSELAAVFLQCRGELEAYYKKENKQA